jgi:hypothetical protein
MLVKIGRGRNSQNKAGDWSHEHCEAQNTRCLEV